MFFLSFLLFNCNQGVNVRKVNISSVSVSDLVEDFKERGREVFNDIINGETILHKVIEDNSFLEIVIEAILKTGMNHLLNQVVRMTRDDNKVISLEDLARERNLLS